MTFQHLYSEIYFEATRSSGPGGQHVNKTNSAVCLRWNLWYSPSFTEEQKQRIAKNLSNYLNSEGEIWVRCQEARSLHENKAKSVEKFFALLKKALFVPKKRKATKPTRASKLKRVEKKRQRSEIKSYRRKVDY